jgi:hypothetical protein
MGITNAPVTIRYSCSTSSAIWNAAPCAPGNVHSADGWEGVLKPGLARYRGTVSRVYFRADAGFANPDVYEFLETERVKYAIRSPSQPRAARADRIHAQRVSAARPTMSGDSTRTLPIRPEAGRGRPGSSPRSNGIWANSIRRLGFVVTDMARPLENAVALYNKRGTCEPRIKEGKGG